jgi:hypothetical protein
VNGSRLPVHPHPTHITSSGPSSKTESVCIRLGVETPPFQTRFSYTSPNPPLPIISWTRYSSCKREVFAKACWPMITESCTYSLYGEPSLPEPRLEGVGIAESEVVLFALPIPPTPRYPSRKSSGLCVDGGKPEPESPGTSNQREAHCKRRFGNERQ